MLNFIRNIDWLNLMKIEITVVAIIAILGIGGYLWWAWSKDQWPF